MFLEKSIIRLSGYKDFPSLGHLQVGFQNIIPVRFSYDDCLKPKPQCTKVAAPKKKGCDLGMPTKSNVPEDDKTKKSELSPEPSMWELLGCCVRVCDDTDKRFDELYYKTSNKSKRVYYRTWKECPKVKYRLRKICCPVKQNFPKKRVPCMPHVLACTHNCHPNRSKCGRITLRGCCRARYPPSCRPEARVSKKCDRVKTPFPSFSQCKQLKSKPYRNIECTCMKKVSLCDIYREMRRLGIESYMKDKSKRKQ